MTDKLDLAEVLRNIDTWVDTVGAPAREAMTNAAALIRQMENQTLTDIATLDRIKRGSREPVRASGHTPGPWFMSGVRFRMNGGEWHSINRYDEALKQDENVCCVGYDPRTGIGMADARLIAAAPCLLAQLEFAVKLLRPWCGGTAQVERMEEVIAKARGAA